MAEGDELIIGDTTFVVVWDGGELLPPRDSKPSDLWEITPERRKYTKTGKHHKVKTHDVSTV